MLCLSTMDCRCRKSEEALNVQWSFEADTVYNRSYLVILFGSMYFDMRTIVGCWTRVKMFPATSVVLINWQ